MICIKLPTYIIPLLLNYKDFETEIITIFGSNKGEINEQLTNIMMVCKVK
jgi:hypothetical protein